MIHHENNNLIPESWSVSIKRDKKETEQASKQTNKQIYEEEGGEKSYLL